MKQTIDTLFTNGRIYSLRRKGSASKRWPWNGASSFLPNRCRSPERFAPRQHVDLKGMTMLPGMGTHVHFYATCQALTTVDLLGCKTKAEAVMRLGRGRRKHRREPIKGPTSTSLKWQDADDRLPTRQDLDQASTRHPIVIKRVCLHAAVGNTPGRGDSGYSKGICVRHRGFGGIGGGRDAKRRFSGTSLRSSTRDPDPLRDPVNRRILMKRVFDQISPSGSP